MSSLLRRLRPTQERRIAVVQYMRDVYGIGTEHELHWALVVLTDEDSQKGPCFQAIDRHYSDGRGVVWSLYDKDVALGVCVGSVSDSQVQSLRETVARNPPVVKFEGWNCRDWIIEILALLKQGGWVQADVSSQAALLPSMKVASKATVDARAKSSGALTAIVELIVAQ